MTGTLPAADLSDRQRQLLAKMLADGERAASDFPTTYAQRRQWLLHQLAPASSGYAMPIALRMRGPFDEAALREALRDVAERHEALRTTFPSIDGRPTQRVHAHASVPIETRAWLGSVDALLPEIRACAMAPFELAAGPLIRTTVWRLAPHEHVLLVVAHHIIADGWSVEVLMRDLSAAYRAHTRGDGAVLAPLAIQPADYAAWEAAQISAAGLGEHLEYWRSQFEAPVAAGRLPADHPRPRGAAGPAGRVRTTVDASLVAAVGACAREHRTTEFVVLLAAFAAVLGRFVGQSDVVIGTPLSGRIRRETADLVGCFVNTLPIRLRTDADASVATLLTHLREQTTEMQRHQLVPFDLLVEQILSTRDAAANPLFDVVFTLQDAARPVIEFDGLTVDPIDLQPETAKFDLACVISRCGDELEIAWDYRADVVDGATVESLAACFDVVVRAIPADPGRRVVDIDLPRTLLVDEPGYSLPAGGVPELFARQVLAGPDKVAIWEGEASITYAQLDLRANQLADALRAAGVGPEVGVGICLPRSIDFAVACLAVVKAGGYYVPLDPSYPVDRLQFMATDSGLRHVVTRRGLTDRVAGPVPVFVEDIRDGVPTEPLVPVQPDSLCLAIYTSGSTGRPKAVGITQRGLSDLVLPGQYCGFAADAVVLWLSSISFDVATWEIWGTLLHGATGVVSAERAYTAREIGATVAGRGVSTALFTPALFNAIVDEDVTALAGLRWLLVGGEALSPAHVRRARGALDGTRLMNAYGPAEITTLASCHRVGDDERLEWTVPIGVPVSGTTMTIVDRDGRLVPPGAVGELWLSGSGLARGYLGRPGLTAARFVPAPDGGRWYRTGDLVRQAAGGPLVFCGRADDQVKVRGHRVEPGEVRGMLLAQDSVARAVVVARPHGAADCRLIAYVVPSGAGDVGNLRDDLRRQLPDYLVPAHIITVDTIPVTTNGKVDVAALPAPEPTAVGRGPAQPRTPTEDQVAQAWADVLDVDATVIGPDDDFFALGGHSLLAAMLVTRLRDQIGVEVPLVDVFENPTLAQLATDVARCREDGRTADAGYPRAPRPAPLSYAQQRLWFLTQLDPDSAAYNVPLAARIEGLLDVEALQRSIAYVVERHEVLRSVIDETPDGYVQIVRPVDEIPRLSIVDVSGAADPAQAAVSACEEAARRPFRLLSGELPVRATLVRCAADEHVLCLTIHHIAADGWSVGVIANELSHAYAALRAGSEPDLPALTRQFADVAFAQQSRHAPAELEARLAAWRESLAGAPRGLNLPTLWPRSDVRGSRGGVARVQIDADTTARVRALALEAGCTEYVILLSAFAATLGVYSGQAEFLLGTPIANRSDRFAERLVGFLANTVVLRLDTSGDPTVIQLLERVRRASLGALAHQDLPFERLVDHLAPDRDPARNPLFQVMFAWDNTPAPEIRLPGLTVAPVYLAGPGNRFDMAVSLTGRDGTIDGFCEYDADVFDAAIIEAFFGYFAATVAAFATDPTLPLSSTDAANPAARQLLESRRPGAPSSADDVESIVAGVWVEVLDSAEPITDMSADFFALGGHSFLAARIASRLTRRFGVDVGARVMFEHRTVSSLAAWIRAQTRGQVTEIPRLDHSVTRGPLTFAQERLWFLAQFAPESPAYNLPLVARVEGPFDRDAFQGAVRWLVARHESLRTRYGNRDGVTSQRVLDRDDAVPTVAERDVSTLPDAFEAARALVDQEAFRPFDLAGGELPLRALVVRVAAEDHIVALTAHHLAVDGWGVQVLVRDVFAAYSLFREGREPEAAPPALRYLDYATWQRTALDDAVLTEHLAFWRAVLDGAPQVLDLPASRPRPSTRRYQGASIDYDTGSELTAKLRALARDNDCTEFMVLVAAFATVLSRYSGQRDLLIGTPIANRVDPATESLVGLLANTVVLRADLRGDPTVRELLRRIRAMCLDAFAHQDTPFEKLVEQLATARDGSRSPLFQVMLALNNAPAHDLSVPGLRCTALEPENPTAKFDIVLNLSDHENVAGVCEYDRDVYDAGMMSGLLAHLTTVLAEFTARPWARLSDVDILSGSERERLITTFNQVPSAYEHRVCLHRLVERAVDSTPDAVAVVPAVDPARSVTYRELDVAANRLAHALIRQGVRPDDVVAVCLDRSVGLVIAEYAALKAGAAYLPIDPGWPASRVAEVLADSGCRVALVRAGAAISLPPEVLAVPIALDGADDGDAADDSGAADDRDASRPVVAVGPGHRAYLIYTSGSTGRPKGAVLEHAAISNNLLWMQQDWPLDANDRLLHKTASTFDVAVKEVFWPLLAGATLVLAEPGSQRDPQALLDQLGAHAITITHFVPSMLDLVLEVAEQRDTTLGSDLRYVMCGAETLSAVTQQRFFQASRADLLHMYGPTETAIAVTGLTCRPSEESRARIPLGRPMPNSALYVLDADLNPVPALVWGELYVGGPPLARGYLGRPVETAAAFRPDPFSNEPGARMYRTGDVVRHGPDGLLEFRGRVDNQVKVRGFRVELGEVEAALRTHPAVRQAIVVVAGVEQSDAHLVGYVVPVGGQARPTSPELRRHLQQRLPEHMVPATVVLLDRLPLNANGKVHRAALPAPERPDRDLDTAFVAPRDETERAVAELWSQVLGVEPVGVNDDFFALGGQSLQAAAIVAQLRDRFGREVALRDMFAEPTVARVAQALRTTEEPATLPKISRRGA